VHAHILAEARLSAQAPLTLANTTARNAIAAIGFITVTEGTPLTGPITVVVAPTATAELIRNALGLPFVYEDDYCPITDVEVTGADRLATLFYAALEAAEQAREDGSVGNTDTLDQTIRVMEAIIEELEAVHAQLVAEQQTVDAIEAFIAAVGQLSDLSSTLDIAEVYAMAHIDRIDTGIILPTSGNQVWVGLFNQYRNEVRAMITAGGHAQIAREELASASAFIGLFNFTTLEYDDYGTGNGAFNTSDPASMSNPEQGSDRYTLYRLANFALDRLNTFGSLANDTAAYRDLRTQFESINAHLATGGAVPALPSAV
jgi:hypothetical protein